MYKVSIVTVVFNNLKGIEKTIQSVVNQDYLEKEYIIIDGGSTDGTLEVIKKYSSRINFFVSEKDKGIFDAMNKSLKNVHGEFVIFMNSGDELYDETTLSKVFNNLDNFDADIIYGDTVISTLNGEKKHISTKPLGSIKNGRLPFYHQSAIVKTNLMKQNLFPLKYHVSADYYLFLKFYKEGYKFRKINLPISLYEIGGFSYSNLLLGDKQKQEIINEFGFSAFRPVIQFKINTLKYYLKSILKI